VHRIPDSCIHAHERHPPRHQASWPTLQNLSLSYHNVRPVCTDTVAARSKRTIFIFVLNTEFTVDLNGLRWAGRILRVRPDKDMPWSTSHFEVAHVAGYSGEEPLAGSSAKVTDPERRAQPRRGR
jgi:hypothetical protein